VTADENGHPTNMSSSSETGDAGDKTTARPAEKDPADWVTGGEPMTGPQESYLSTLAREAGEQAPHDITKAAASEQIERLQREAHRGG